MDHLDIGKAAIIGFSIGGMINRRFAMDYPDRVSALAILNSPHNRGEAGQQQVEERAKLVDRQGAGATLDEALKRWFTPGYLTDGEGVALARKWCEATDPPSYAGAAWVLANGVRELIAPEPPIRKPALVMTSENDARSTPQMSREISQEIAGSRLHIVPELQHLGPDRKA